VSRRTILIFSFLSLLLSGCTPAYQEVSPALPIAQSTQEHPKVENKKLIPEEDVLLIIALDDERHGIYSSAYQNYKKLFDRTGREEYLQKLIDTGIQAYKYDEVAWYAQTHLNKDQTGTKKTYLTTMINLHIQQKEYHKALEYVTPLLEHHHSIEALKLASALYLILNDYETSLTYLKEAYEQTQDRMTLWKMVEIELNYRNSVDDAITLLRNHQQFVGCDEELCLKLASIYQQQKAYTPLAMLYQAMYQNLQNITYANKAIDLMLIQKEYQLAIDFIEEYELSYDRLELLFELYKTTGNIKKASQSAAKLYQKTKNKEYLAQEAILAYESATIKDQKILKEVRHKLTSAIEEVDKAIYLNYLGYLLVDHDIDYPSGIDYIKRALHLEPDSPYYLDSLAWGYYKQRKYQKAHDVMQRIDQLLNHNLDPEIEDHRKAINLKLQKDTK
jgi:tetratricopeptide (TPR) repeat protein